MVGLAKIDLTFYSDSATIFPLNTLVFCLQYSGSECEDSLPASKYTAEYCKIVKHFLKHECLCSS